VIEFYASPTSQPTSHPSMDPTTQPSRDPTSQPTEQPTRRPSGQPSVRPSDQPTTQPTAEPTEQPTSQPSSHPSSQPTDQPTRNPTSQPTSFPSSQPTEQPSSSPSTQPSEQPTSIPTLQPTEQPTSVPSNDPSSQPTDQPTNFPTSNPSSHPSSQPSCQPTDQPTRNPTGQPTRRPSSQPSSQPSRQPNTVPTGQPTCQPSGQPTFQPTGRPSKQPTGVLSRQPSRQPSGNPSNQPTAHPSAQPSHFPSEQPSSHPSTQPTSQPSNQPSNHPSGQPTRLPTRQPTNTPSNQPTSRPSIQPSGFPSNQPSTVPTNQPTSIPSSQPSGTPSIQPTSLPSRSPTGQPTHQPTSPPTSRPSRRPSGHPSNQPTGVPTNQPSDQPTDKPTSLPTTQPSHCPSAFPSKQPSSLPSSQPTLSPTNRPTTFPSTQPTSIPSGQPSCCPSTHPSDFPSTLPTVVPSIQPGNCPTGQPVSFPTTVPSNFPTSLPSISPTSRPSVTPSVQPSTCPSVYPSLQPTNHPSSDPSSVPSLFPSNQPSSFPSSVPTDLPSNRPTNKPSCTPSSVPTNQPTQRPSVQPSLQPVSFPTTRPSRQPFSRPSSQPSRQPTATPSSRPTKARPPSSSFPTLSILPLSNNNHLDFKETLFSFGSYLPAVENIPNFSFNDSLVGSSFIIFGFRGNERGKTVKEITIGTRESFGSYTGLVNTNSGLNQDRRMSRASLPIGDFNGDSTNDLLVCDPRNSICRIYSEKGNGKSGKYEIYLVIKNINNDLFGWSIAKLNGVNKDACDDIAITSLSSNIITILFGSKDLWKIQQNEIIIKNNTNALPSSVGIRIIGSRNTRNIGLALSSAGDFNNDGYADILFSAIQISPYQNVIYILFLNAKILLKQDIIMDYLSTRNGDYFKITAPLFSFAGFSLSNLGDINQDGFDDVIIGSIPYSGRYLDQKSYVIYGRSNSSSDLSLTEMNEEDGFIITGGGFMVGGPGDVNGDGIPDMMISSYQQWQGQGNSYIMVYPRNISSPPTFLPSSQPSSSPSTSPSLSPTLIISNNPSNAPILKTTQQPMSAGSTFPPSSSLKPTRTPSLKPTTRSPTLKPSVRPSFATSRKPTDIPTRLPSLIPTSSRAPSRSPTTNYRQVTDTDFRFPTSFPSLFPTASLSTPFQEISLTAEGTYQIPAGKANLVISGEGSFEFSSVEGDFGAKIYTILPSKNIITIADFNKRYDRLNFVHFPSLSSINNLVYTSNPLQIILASDQKWILQSLDLLSDLTEENFMFRLNSEDHRKKKTISFQWDLSAVICLGILVCCIGVFGCGVVERNNTQKDDKDFEQKRSELVGGDDDYEKGMNDQLSREFDSELSDENDREESFGSLRRLFTSDDDEDDEEEDAEESGTGESLGERGSGEDDASSGNELQNDFHLIHELITGNTRRDGSADDYDEEEEEEAEGDFVVTIPGEDQDLLKTVTEPPYYGFYSQPTSGYPHSNTNYFRPNFTNYANYDSLAHYANPHDYGGRFQFGYPYLNNSQYPSFRNVFNVFDPEEEENEEEPEPSPQYIYEQQYLQEENEKYVEAETYDVEGNYSREIDDDAGE
jgi:hypothetical protein